MQTNILDTFYIVDFDRTLVRSDDLRLLFEEAAFAQTAIPSERIKQGELLYRNNFDVVAYLRGVLLEVVSAKEAEASIENVKKYFIEKARSEDLLEPYASAFLSELRERRAAFGILTSGGEEWQQVKIEATGLNDIPHLVIGSPKKSELIARWRRPDDIFVLPEKLSGIVACEARKIVFLDDKPVSFEGIPDNVRGIWVLPIRSAIAYDIEKLEVPGGIQHAHGLKEARDLLFGS
jgi:FMN phosphatase YigB (HAD superfamily)